VSSSQSSTDDERQISGVGILEFTPNKAGLDVTPANFDFTPNKARKSSVPSCNPFISKLIKYYMFFIDNKFILLFFKAKPSKCSVEAVKLKESKITEPVTTENDSEIKFKANTLDNVTSNVDFDASLMNSNNNNFSSIQIKIDKLSE
jgi:hypothetical protein